MEDQVIDTPLQSEAVQENTQVTLNPNPPVKQKKSVLKIIFTVLIIVIFMLALSFATFFILSSTTTNNKALLTEERPVEVSSKTKGSLTKYLALNNVCENGPVKDLTIKLTKAYLLSDFADLPDYKIKQIQQLSPDAVKLLVIEADLESTLPEEEALGVYGQYILRLLNNKVSADPIIYGSSVKAYLGTNKTIYTYFPVGESDNNFTISYCNLDKDPQNLNLDFSSVTESTEEFLIDKGFSSSK